MKAVVLLSGGLDSAVCAAMAAEQFGNENVYPITFTYGQRHRREIDAASKIASHMGLQRLRLIEVGSEIFERSILVDESQEVPTGTYQQVNEEAAVSPMYVPFRNGVFLSLAAAYAMTVDAGYVFYGGHKDDSRNWAYPDTTPEFNDAMAEAIYVGTYQKVQLAAPLAQMTKSDVVLATYRLEVPIKLTYSCYKGGYLHCGECSTCKQRIQAFKDVYLQDEVKYAIDVEWSIAEIADTIDLQGGQNFD